MLLVFIGWRNAVFAALGIPVAFMATFWFMSIAGYSLSGVSLFGLILVVGIVVGRRDCRHREHLSAH